jgi:hypothetical protein
MVEYFYIPLQSIHYFLRSRQQLIQYTFSLLYNKEAIQTEKYHFGSKGIFFHMYADGLPYKNVHRNETLNR